MKVIKKITELRSLLQGYKKDGKSGLWVEVREEKK